jgi:energy-coupling factor transport system ATP-binding protein
VIQIEGLSVRYGEVTALDGLDLAIPAGQFVLVSGPSGCGKSTLARALSGLVPQAIPAQMAGTVTVAGSSTRDLPVAALATRVGSVFQNPNAQLFHLRVADEVAFGPRNLGLQPAEVEARVDWALAAADLTALRDRQPSALSGGQQQRVAIAAALAMRPDVLVLDEPTASLDPEATRLVLGTLRRLHREAGMTIILIEHRLAEVAELAERVLLLDRGRLVADGPPSLLRDPGLQAELGLRPVDQAPPPAWEQVLHPCQQSAAREPFMTLEQVAAGYGQEPAIEQVSLALYPGEFVALVGPNGAGKTTLALALAGRLKPMEGTIHLNGQEKAKERRLRRRRRKLQPGRDVGLLFQNPAEQLFTDTVDDEVAFGPRNFGRYEARSHEELLQEADLQELRARQPAHLSLGQQQRTALAAALALHPRLLILDEPTMGQDWGHLRQLMNFAHSLTARGTAVLMITHDQQLVADYAERVLVMDKGRVCLDGYVATEEPGLEEETGLLKRRNLE